MIKLINHGLWVLALAWLCGGAAQAQTGPTYQITVDTSSELAIAGDLFFTFAPSSNNSLAATADITNFTGGTLGTANPNNDDVAATGSLGSSLSLANMDASVPPNPGQFTQAFTYGSGLSFDIGFNGPAFNPTQVGDSSTLSLFLADNSGNTLLTNNPNGEVLDITIPTNATYNPTTGATDVTTDNSSISGASGPVLTITELMPNGGGGAPVVPEPPVGLLLAVGLALLGLLRRVGARRLREA